MTDKPVSAAKPAAPSPAKGDDRNVVSVAPAGAGAGIDERLFIFWKNYRTSVLVAVCVALLIIIGRFAWDAYSAGHEESIRAAYAKASTTESKRRFARENTGHPLAGVALLALADEAYANADYAGAGRDYAAAAAALKDPLLAPRARLGEGMAALQAGDKAKGEPILRKLAVDAQVSAPLRWEAWYMVAALKVSESDSAAAREAITKLMELKPSNMWIGRAMGLQALLPPETPAAASETAASASTGTTPVDPAPPAAP